MVRLLEVSADAIESISNESESIPEIKEEFSSIGGAFLSLLDVSLYNIILILTKKIQFGFKKTIHNIIQQGLIIVTEGGRIIHPPANHNNYEQEIQSEITSYNLKSLRLSIQNHLKDL